jgi:hypothetical protein
MVVRLFSGLWRLLVSAANERALFRNSDSNSGMYFYTSATNNPPFEPPTRVFVFP